MGNEHESEAQLENHLIRRLSAIGYQTITIKDENSLVTHFRDILNQRNADNLNGVPLTDAEFERVENELIGSKSIYEIAQLLRGSDIQPYGKIEIQRDDNTQLFLNFFDGRNWENNIFEVTHQITIPSKYQNRYDVTILINGMPIVQIELKRRGVDYTEAFHQIIRYRNESFRNLFRLVQLFVVSNGEETRYFANGDGNLNANFMFYWTDSENHWLNDIDAFAASFFDRQRLHSLIADYTIFDRSNERMLIMRPYQIYATEAILKQATEHPDRNGYIWHTTGSGKTITSFKASQLLSRLKTTDQIIFLIDRADLDLQTAKNFNSYLPTTVSNEPALDRTDNTASLVKQLQSSDNPLIITTIQKLNNAVKEDSRYKNILEPFHDKHVIFIEDEAHRTQFGDMRKNINKWFKNAEHFGFTGTPIFAENVGIDGRTTETLYDEELHHYLIKDAIRDHNVLGFSIQYIGTIKGKNITDDEQIPGIDTKEAFENDERLKMIVQHIMLNHNQLTANRQYNAIFTVSSTEMALKYYHMFKQLDINHQLNVTTIFTWKANEDDAEEKQDRNEKSARHGLDDVISDYNQKFDTDFDTEHFADYFADVSKRMKEHNAKTPENNIDVLIVVNMFLTGFDSPRLSTLYIDKKLKYQNLIQAFSRTNRIEKKTKPFGNIVSYRNLKKATDDAVKLFSAGSQEDFFVPSYDELAGQFADAISALKKTVPTPAAVDGLFNAGTDQLTKFVLDFREIMRVFSKIRVYDEFEFNKFPGLPEKEMEAYRSKYFDAYREIKKPARTSPDVSILDDIDFEIELLETDRIDVQYIVNLIKTINLDSSRNRKADSNKIRRLLQNADSEELKSKADLLEAFLDEVVPHLDKQSDVGDELNQYLARRRREEVYQFSEENKVPVSVLNDQLSNYMFYGHTNSEDLTKALNEAGYSFKQKISLKKKLKTFVLSTINRFTISQ
jgi:type I restriction enzyme R subunit